MDRARFVRWRWRSMATAIRPSPTGCSPWSKSRVRPGSIVSLHLGHQITIAALPRILDGLSTKRLQPVTLTELLT